VHQRHTDNTAYAFACEQCHALNSTRGNTTHLSGDDNASSGRYVEVRFTDNESAAWSYDNTAWKLRSLNLFNSRFGMAVATPTYGDNAGIAGTDGVRTDITWSAGSCGAVWCHSNANPAQAGGGNNIYRAPAWATPATPRCTLCHLGPDGYDNMVATVTNPASGGMSHGHQVHLATDRYRFTCDECHANTVATDCTTALNASTGYAQHVNGSKSVSGQDVRGGTGVRLSPINDNLLTYTAGRTCTSTYCHSPGVDNDAAGGFDNAVESPAWDSGSTGCTSCHGGTLASGKPMATGRHLRHLQEGYRCSNCHALTIAPDSDNVIKTTPDGNGKTGYDYHVNGVKDYVAGDGYSFTPGSCNNISCHGGTGATWTGPPIGCTTCHLSNNVDNDYYLSGTDNLYAGQDPPRIDNGEWLWSGHGKPSGGNYDVSGFPAANFPGGVSGAGDPCNFCHDNAVTHNTPANPFRLKNQTGVSGYGALGWNATCLVCHSGSPVAPGYDPDGTGSDYASRKAQQSFADNAHYGTEHASTRNGGKFCWDCHDPHGDRTASNGNNIFMIHGGSAARGGTSVSRLLRASDNTYGIRGSSGVLTTNAPIFTGIASGTNYADNTTFRGICQVCHTQATTGHYRENFGDGHNASSRCTQCHKHDTAFAPSECKGCHGPDGVATAQAAPNVGTYWTSSGHGMTTPKVINVQCDACHDTGFLTGTDHKVDGSAGAGPPPANINTQIWPGKTENANNQRNQNTAHLRSDYFPAGYPGATPSNKYEFARAFDLKCGTPAAGCHPAAAHNHHPVVPGVPQPVDRVMRFPDGGTATNPKVYYWYPALSDYAAQFYQSRSPWDINDLTTGAAGTYADNSVRYGVCVSCHDPHGTAAPANLGAATNQMLRGDTLNAGQFCNAACHTTRTPP
jgi:predicted CxxxxCH...CXXCH cytochrome family protein